jgi:hypothetical protein
LPQREVECIDIGSKRIISPSRNEVNHSQRQCRIVSPWARNRTPPGAAKGVAVGDEPESMYAVFSGRNYNNHCCFDYVRLLSSSMGIPLARRSNVSHNVSFCHEPVTA